MPPRLSAIARPDLYIGIVITLLATASSCQMVGSGAQPPQTQPVSSSSALSGWHRFGLKAGGALLGSLDTEIRLDSKTQGRGTKLDFEDDLGIKSSTQVFRGDAFYRFNRRHRVDVSYFDIERKTTRAIDKQIQFGDTSFSANVDVTAEFNTQIFKVPYRYVLIPEDHWELGISAGVHWMRFNTNLRSQSASASESFRADAPWPVLGLHGEWRFASDFRFKASTELLYLELSDVGSTDKITGLVSDNVVALEWDAFDHVGVGLGYNYFVLNGDVDRDGKSLSAIYEYQGLLLYAEVFF